MQDRQTEVDQQTPTQGVIVQVGMVRCIYCTSRFAITLPPLGEHSRDEQMFEGWPLCCGERVWLDKAWGWVGSPTARHSLTAGTQPQEEAV